MNYEKHFSSNSFPYKDVIKDRQSSFANHCHKEFEIIHIRKGSTKLIYQKKLYRVY